MKYKFTLLLFVALAGLSASIKQQPAPPDTGNMVLIETGTFMMGIDSVQLAVCVQKFNAPASVFSQEYPAFRVTVPHFYLDKYEVTNADFKKFIDANPRWNKQNIADSLRDGGNYLKDWNGNKYPKGKAAYPVVYVNWYAAYAYARWLGKRLPTESEREYAAKGTDKAVLFPWGNADAASTKANYLQSNIGHTVKSGSYPPNGFGLYDLAGNVWEFCADWWHSYAYASRKKAIKTRTMAPNRPGDINQRVIRGGGWNSPAIDLRTTRRRECPAVSCAPDIGFRCAANARAK